MTSARPSERSRRQWQRKYSFVLPPGSSDFQAHWKSDDIGVQIFSVRVAEGVTGEHARAFAGGQLKGYRLHESRPDEVAYRRSVTYSDQRGFDEFRFRYEPSRRRLFVMFANLDDEMNAHSELVKQFEAIARGAEKQRVRSR